MAVSSASRLAALASLVASASGLACSGLSSSNTTTGFSPETGIIVRADALVRDFGCGSREGQVFKYAATVYDSDRKIVVPRTRFDCFADATFTNLKASQSESLRFVLEVFAFDVAGVAAIDAAGGSDDALLRNTAWGTSCEATQQKDVAVLAVCKPLTPTARLTLDTRSFAAKVTDPKAEPPPPYTCGVDFASVAVVATHPTLGDKYTNAPPTRPNGTECPASPVMRVLSNETYQVTVSLVDKAGRAFRTGKCSVYAKPGEDSPIVCPPL